MHIRAKGRGKWQCVWEVRDPLTGQRRRVTQIVRGTKKDAERVWTTRAAALERRPVALDPAAQPTRPEDWTVRRLLALYLADPTVRRPRTRQDYARLVRLYLDPLLGPLPLPELTRARVQAAVTAWATRGGQHGQGLAPRTVRQCLAVLSGACAQAVAWGLLPANPCQGVARPRLTASPAAIWTPADMAAFWAVARRHRHGRLFGLLLATGLRPGEALGLQWADVDWDAAALHVRHTLLPRALWPDAATPAFGEPKTARGQRTVALDADTVRLLRDEHAAQAADRLACGPAWRNRADLVFTTRVGTPLLERNVVRLFRALVRQAGVRPLRLYDLRHCHASLLIAAGADPRLVSERLGHSSVAFTLDTYAHLWPSRQHDILERAAPLFRLH